MITDFHSNGRLNKEVGDDVAIFEEAAFDC